MIVLLVVVSVCINSVTLKEYMSDKKYMICTKPFEWFEASRKKETGYPVYLCCPGWLPTSIGNLNDQAPLEIWHSEEAKKIRRSVTDGSFKYCKKEFCPHLNEVSGPVKYVDQGELDVYKSMAGNESFSPKVLNCSYDNSCNLVCPTCRIELMMAKAPERKKINSIGERLIKDLGDVLEVLYVTGSGDPFASRHYLEMLTNGQLKKYPNIKLRLHTNAQLFTADTWKKLSLSEDKIFGLEVSIDGATKATYEENRKPGKWEILVENMKFIAGLKRSGVIEELRISFVVQANNFREINDFIRLGREWSVDSIYFATLNDWETFSKAEQKKRSVHRRGHAEHSLLLAELRKIDLSIDGLILDLGYFKKLIDKAVQPSLLNWFKRQLRVFGV